MFAHIGAEERGMEDQDAFEVMDEEHIGVPGVLGGSGGGGVIILWIAPAEKLLAALPLRRARWVELPAC